MIHAIWKDTIIAEINETIVIERNHYFPMDSVNHEFLKENDFSTVCHWKGTASYYDVLVNGQVNQNAAWYYQNPSELAGSIKNHVAFWKDVQIIEATN